MRIATGQTKGVVGQIMKGPMSLAESYQTVRYGTVSDIGCAQDEYIVLLRVGNAYRLATYVIGTLQECIDKCVEWGVEPIIPEGKEFDYLSKDALSILKEFAITRKEFWNSIDDGREYMFCDILEHFDNEYPGCDDITIQARQAIAMGWIAHYRQYGTPE